LGWDSEGAGDQIALSERAGPAFGIRVTCKYPRLEHQKPMNKKNQNQPAGRGCFGAHSKKQSFEKTRTGLIVRGRVVNALLCERWTGSSDIWVKRRKVEKKKHQFDLRCGGRRRRDFTKSTAAQNKSIMGVISAALSRGANVVLAP